MNDHLVRTTVLAAALLAVTACSPGGGDAKAPTAPAAPAKAAPAPASPLKEIETPGAAKDATTDFRADTADVVLQPAGSQGDRLEYKVRMKAGDTLTYAWDAEGAKALWHEFHGHTDEAVSFYKKAEGAAHKGVLVAPFDGIHGWYFENRAPTQVVIRLRMGGFYELVAGD
jgi:hypothetical protein